MKNITVEELKELLTNVELSSFESEVERLIEELDVEPKKLAAALLKKVNDTIPYQKKEKVLFRSNPNAQRFFINIGSFEELNVNALMDFIIEHVPGVERKNFSDVYIRDKFSFFELPKERSEEVLKNLNGISFKERHVRVELSEKRERKSSPEQ